MISHGRRAPIAVVGAAIALLTAACGSRLPTSQLALGAGGAVVGSSGSSTSETTQGGAAISGGTGASTAAGPSASGGGPAGGGSGQQSAPGAGASGTTSGAKAASGGGGASDVGVSATSITIGNIADVSGVVPGLFRTAQQATIAFAAYVNSTGGIYGRTLKVVAYDSQTDGSAYRTAAVEACSKSFALVGSLSVFDDAGASSIDKCKLPNVASGVATAGGATSTYTFPATQPTAHFYPNGSAVYFVRTHPAAVKKAAMLYLNAASSIQIAQNRMKAWKKAGFDWIYSAQVGVTEPNYAPYVLQMRQQGVQFVTAQADEASTIRLLQAMEQQNWHPEVIQLTEGAYSPSFLSNAGKAAEGAILVMGNGLYTDASNNGEAKLFLTWMNKINPGFKQDSWAFPGWASGRLFQRALIAAGPNPTRASLTDALRKVETFDGGGGLVGPSNPAKKIPSNCYLVAVVKSGAFVRTAPASGYNCNDGELVKVG